MEIQHKGQRLRQHLDVSADTPEEGDSLVWDQGRGLWLPRDVTFVMEPSSVDTVHLVDGSVTTDKLGMSSVTLEKLDFVPGEPVTSLEGVLDSNTNIPNTNITLITLTPGRVGVWFVAVSFDVGMTGTPVFLGAVRRNTTTFPGNITSQGPDRTMLTQNYLIPITSVSQTINSRAAVSSTDGTSTAFAPGTKLVMHWLHP